MLLCGVQCLFYLRYGVITVDVAVIVVFVVVVAVAVDVECCSFYRCVKLFVVCCVVFLVRITCCFVIFVVAVAFVVGSLVLLGVAVAV